MPTTRNIRTLRVVYLQMDSNGKIACRWEDTPIPNRADYLQKARDLVNKLRGGDPSGPGTGTRLDIMEFKKPTRVVYFMDTSDWSFATPGFRFNGDKQSGWATSNDTYDEIEILDLEGPQDAVTVVNANENGGKSPGTKVIYGYDLVFSVPEDLIVTIDPGGENDGKG